MIAKIDVVAKTCHCHAPLFTYYKTNFADLAAFSADSALNPLKALELWESLIEDDAASFGEMNDSLHLHENLDNHL